MAAQQTTELGSYLEQHKDHLKGIYFVDEKTANNLKITVKDGVSIPLQFKNLVEDLLNLTTERNEILSPSSSSDTIPKILKFMPLEPIFTRSGNEFKITDGISFIDNSELIINTSPFGEFSFGEKRNGVKKKRFTIEFDGVKAVEQILQSKNFILDQTKITDNFLIVVHTEEPDIFSLKIFDCPEST
jgi:hypothetical protein